MLKTTILDGYVDEPTCLGVPPYISPYPRYIAGAVWYFDSSAKIFYVTIDQIRKNISLLDDISKSDIIIVIAGMLVPGHYLSGYPISPYEIKKFFEKITKPIKILCGPAARYGFGLSGGKKIRETLFLKDVFDFIIKGDSETVISDILENKMRLEQIDPLKCRKSSKEIRDKAIIGSNIVKQHPFFPHYLISEIETYRGCPRSIIGGCSFCSEPSKGLPDFRPIKDIVDEIRALYDNGVRHFRLGNQPCIFSYMSNGAGEVEFPRPNPVLLEKLFSNIRKGAPNLKTLHIDNANPGIIARYPEECVQIAKIIIKYHTSGDVAAFGVESVDPDVIKKNNLKANAEEVMAAIKLLNRVGAKKGINGMPELLPGLNFICGLDGETKNTFKLNFSFLKDILDRDLLIRRINIRQILPIPNTKMEKTGNRLILKHKAEFKKFKMKIRNEIERPMLKKMLPVGSILQNMYMEKHDGKISFGRQIGSYPLLIGVPGVFDLHSYYNVKVVDYGYRSITAVPFPFNINNAPRESIEAIPGIGKKRATKILLKRPFKDKNEFIDLFDDENIGRKLFEYINF